MITQLLNNENAIQYCQDNIGVKHYAINHDNYTITPCQVEYKYNFIQVRPYKIDGTLQYWASGCSINDIFVTLEEAEVRLEHIISLYFEDFAHKPYIKIGMLEEHKDKFVSIEHEINKFLGHLPNFNGVHFCDVSAGGVQIMATAKGGGASVTLKYDFSNISHIVYDFVNMWLENVN